MSKSNASARASTAGSTPPRPAVWLLLLRRTCMLYTAIALFVLLIQLIISGNRQGVSALNFLLLIPFAACIALAGLLRTSDKLPMWGKLLSHPLLTLGGFYLCVYLPARIHWRPTPSMTLVIPILSTVVYGASVTVILLVSRRKRQKTVDATPYESQFKSRS